MERPTEKVAVFIDGNYMRVEIRKLGYKMQQIDFEKFSNLLCNQCDRFRTYYYDAQPELKSKTHEEDDAFIDSLRGLPRFMVQIGRLEYIGNKMAQKGVDVLFTMNLLEISLQRIVNRVIVLTLDRDYIPVIKKARENNTLITFAYFGKPHYNFELKKHCDNIIVIDKNMVEKALR